MRYATVSQVRGHPHIVGLLGVCESASVSEYFEARLEDLVLKPGAKPLPIVSVVRQNVLRLVILPSSLQCHADCSRIVAWSSIKVIAAVGGSIVGQTAAVTQDMRAPPPPRSPET